MKVEAHDSGTKGNAHFLAQPRPRFNCGGWAALAWLALAGCHRVEEAEAPRRTWRFPAEGVQTVQVECWRGREVRVEARAGTTIEISARPRLQPTSFHQKEPDWRTKRPHEWAFGWQTVRAGAALTLRSTGEARFPHHRYLLEEVKVTAPPGVTVTAVRKEQEPRAE